MDSNDQTFKKLERIEKLIDLKRSTQQKKEELQAHIIEETEILKATSAEAQIPFEIDDVLAKFLTTFDDKVHEIEQELINIAA